MFRAIVVAIGLSALGAASIQVQSAWAQPVRVGGDTDAHGCLPSAGATWSTLRRACIQMWVEGTRLDSVKPQGSQINSAFIVFAARNLYHRVELFLPEDEHKDSVILRWSNGTWRGEGYTLTLQQGTYTLADGHGQPIYTGTAAAPN